MVQRWSQTIPQKGFLIVLAVKLLASPHSPWQAYGSSIPRVYGIFAVPSKSHFKGKNHNICHHLSFGIRISEMDDCCFGFWHWFFIAIDKSAINVADSLGFQLSTLIGFVGLLSYTFLHLLVGIFWEYGYLLFPKIDNFIAISSKMKCRLLQMKSAQIQQVAHWPHIHLHFANMFPFFFPKPADRFSHLVGQGGSDNLTAHFCNPALSLNGLFIGYL